MTSVDSHRKEGLKKTLEASFLAYVSVAVYFLQHFYTPTTFLYITTTTFPDFVFTSKEAKAALSGYDKLYQKLQAQDQQLRREDTRLRDQKKKLRTVAENRRSHQSNIKSREKR